jgi:hypothetical protein
MQEHNFLIEIVARDVLAFESNAIDWKIIVAIHNDFENSFAKKKHDVKVTTNF